MRADPPVQADARTEKTDRVVRILGESSTVLYSHLDESNAAREVAEQTAFFRQRGSEVEWKLFGHDQPPNLSDLLREAGYVPDASETLEVLELERPLEMTDLSERIEVRRVTDRVELDRAVAVSRGAFGPERGWETGEYARRLSDPSLAVFIGYVGDDPVTAGRLELPESRSFASLWGGGTLPQFRGRGVYRQLVAARAEVARARGYRYLTVDAMETSRPILERLGFEPLTTMTGWELPPVQPPAPGRPH